MPSRGPRELRNFICMGCGKVFSYAFESKQEHVCERCYPYNKQTWGIMGYPPHRTKAGYERDLAENNRRLELEATTRAIGRLFRSALRTFFLTHTGKIRGSHRFYRKRKQPGKRV